MLGALIRRCCCGPPCGETVIPFAGSFTADGLAFSDPTGWSYAGGFLERTAGTSAVLDWTRPVDVRAQDLVVRITAEMLNASTAGGGVHITVGDVTVSAYVDPDDDKIYATYGGQTRLVADWNADGEILGLQLTARPCGVVIGVIRGSFSFRVATTFLIEFDALDTEYVMGVDGQPGPSDPHPCCEEESRPESWTISGSQMLGTGGSTITYSGSLVWVEADGWWLGTVTRTGGTSTCTGFPTAVAEVVGTAKITCTSDPLGYEFTFNGTTTPSATAECGSATFSVFPLPTTCPAGTVTATAVYSGGGGSGSRFDNVDLVACGRVPEPDCPPSIYCPCPGVPAITCVKVVVPDGYPGIPAGEYELEWTYPIDGRNCGWTNGQLHLGFLDPNALPVYAEPWELWLTYTVAEPGTGEPVVAAEWFRAADPDGTSAEVCDDPYGTYTTDTLGFPPSVEIVPC